ncbi:phosphotransferase [Kribbella sp. NPDC000426]|uniref:phosphotransferase enzyme family protein n=1 Tax=Kribbella sp. NPDC000426 TaxID=3154255 RepID=UPI00332B64AF
MDGLLRRWGLQGYDVRALTAGTNNAGYYVGDDFVLRIHRNPVAPYEHAVLRALGGLSFAVPVPVPADDGSTVVRGELQGEVVSASLSRRIPGEHPVRGDAVRARAAGAALAELDDVLGRLDPAGLPPGAMWDGDLTTIHPRVPSLGPLIDGIPADRRAEVARILTGIRPRKDLPRQIIHGDFAPTNVLMVGDRVTAILDFETCGPGYRAMDLAVGSYFFGNFGQPTAASEAFRRGYLSRYPLTDAELNALPDLELMREATSLVHWHGRYLDGLTTEQDIADRVERLLTVAAHTGRMVPPVG